MRRKSKKGRKRSKKKKISSIVVTKTSRKVSIKKEILGLSTREVTSNPNERIF